MTNGLGSVRLVLLTILLVFAVSLTACSLAPAAQVKSEESPGEILQDTDVRTADASWRTTEPADVSGSASSTVPQEQGSVPSDSSNIDADEIVAAYERVIGGVHTNVLPSVVSIFVLNRIEVSDTFPGFTSPFSFGQRIPQGGGQQQEFFYRNGQGSGFVWDDKGHIVTNRHVVADAERITVVFSDGSDAEAEIVGMDEDSDLAVVKIERDADLLKPVTLGDSNEVRVGQLAITIGNPFGQEFSTTTGIVSAIGRSIRTGDSHFTLPKVLQTDAPMNPGNSGGPLLDRLGRVIGIDAQIITRSGSNTGIGFAIPVNIAKQVIPVLITEGHFTYSWLGIRGTTIRSEAVELMGAPEGTKGAQVIALADDGPAQKAGLMGSSKSKQLDDRSVRYGGDVITGIEGQPIGGMNDLIIYLLEETRPGDVVTMSIVRDGGESAEIEVTLEERPESAN